MGRRDTIEEPETEIKFHLYRMPMTDYCYDSGGAYWGAGDHQLGFMYHAYGDGPEYVNQIFVRAKTRDDAKAQVKARFPNACFYR
jgi:hypothetical protein